MNNQTPNLKELDYLTYDFVRHECSVFGAILSNTHCQLVIAEVHSLYLRGQFHHTGIYWIANHLAARKIIHPSF